MMQVHIDAISASRMGQTQYVLSKSLDIVRIFDKKSLLEHLKSGWEIESAYHNGVGDDNFKICSDKPMEIIKNFIESEHNGIHVKPPTVITVSFQEYFEDVTCKSEKLIAYVNLFNSTNGKLEHENFRFEDKQATKLKNIITFLSIKQDKARLITLLENEIRLESEE